MRVLIDIDDHILRAIENLRADGNKSVSSIVSELLTEALVSRRGPFHWTSRDMRPLVDLVDKDSVRDVT
jgi:hypothetical protein